MGHGRLRQDAVRPPRLTAMDLPPARLAAALLPMVKPDRPESERQAAALMDLGVVTPEGRTRLLAILAEGTDEAVRADATRALARGWPRDPAVLKAFMDCLTEDRRKSDVAALTVRHLASVAPEGERGTFLKKAIEDVANDDARSATVELAVDQTPPVAGLVGLLAGRVRAKKCRTSARYPPHARPREEAPRAAADLLRDPTVASGATYELLHHLVLVKAAWAAARLGP